MKTAIHSSPTALLTAEDLLRLDAQGVRGELVRGVFREVTPAGYRHGMIVVRLAARLLDYADERRCGTVVASDAGILLERDPDTVREPDIAFTSADRLPPSAAPTGCSDVVPDLVVEVASPNDRPGELAERADMWLGFGVRLVWVVHPESKTVEVRTADIHAVETLTEADRLDGTPTLPGFTYPLSQLFAD
ncbi:Uma2 family endonuclease [Candidatus Poriferisodalis sp.]|uniref:Uma2 family endonuclease n=1 Tax=Candidatus Poriferisodalis sp. TaxID=3101277 RepID=UPI003B014556